MSCDFDIACIDCGVGMGFSDLNWGQRYLTPIMKYRTALENFQSMASDENMWWWLDTSSGSQMAYAILFFSAHKGHRCSVISEYGHLYPDDGCGKNDTGVGFCGLAKGHEGSCAPLGRLEYAGPDSNRKWAAP